jgi:chaperone modulatory protein CbpM
MARDNDLPQGAGIVPGEPTELTLAEVCRACGVQAEFIVELVEEGALAPAGQEPQRWHFSYTHLRRARVASRLQSDLGVNLAGAALALELLDRIEALHARLRVLGDDGSGGSAPGIPPQG